MAIFAKAKLGEADNQLLLNDFTIDPVYRTLARAPSKWQIRQQDLPVPFESGSSDFITLIGESAYIISGKMYPSSETAYDVGLNTLRTVASLDIEQADPNSDSGYVPYTWGDANGDFSKQIFVKPLYCQLAETTQQGFVQPFTIYCKVKDPTIYGGTLKVATTQSANFSQTTGAAVFAIAFPVVFGSTLFTVSSTAQNNGTLPGYPASIQIHGPVNVPKITNGATGEFIKVNVNMTSITDILTLTYDKDTLSIDLNGTSEIQNLSSDSTLWKVHPGANVISLTGTSVSTNAYAVVNFYDTYPLA
jgi:hypothetical protein